MRPRQTKDELARLESLIREECREDTRTEAPRPSAATSLPAPLIDGYEILSLLSAGGQGVVYKAQQVSTKRTVALKLLLESFPSDDQLRRFEREIECVARLRHPNVVTVYECRLTDDGRPYFSMEFVDGQALDDYVREKSPPIKERLGLFVKVCDAVDCAHRDGIVHRDLKPSNIRVDRVGEPRVLDFGLARRTVPERPAATAQVTQSGEFLGTLSYAAPEQLDGEPEHVTELTDVWALGVLLYQLLADELPFKSTGSLAKIEKAIREDMPPKPSSLRRGLDADLDTIVFRAMAKEPARRYASAGALAADVRRFLAGEPIEARRDSTTYVIRKQMNRHRVPITVGMLIVALTVASFYYRRVAGVATVEADYQAAKYLLNEARLEAGRHPEAALKLLDQAIRFNPLLVEAKLQRALVLWRVPRVDDAIAAAEETLRLHPNAVAAHILLARFCERRDPEQARQHRSQAAGRQSENVYFDALLEEDDAHAVELLTRVMEEEGLSFDVLVERVVRYQNLHDYRAMLQDARRLLELQPKSANAWNAVGTAQSQLGDYAAALESFAKSLQHEPHMARSYLHRARVLGMLGRHRDAVADCTEALRRDPDDGLAYALRAWAQTELNHDDSAMADCQKAIALSPWDPRPYACRGLIAMRRGNPSAAMEDLNRAISKDPGFYEAYLVRAELHERLREFAEVVEDATAMIDRIPDARKLTHLAAQAHDLRARAHENLGRFDLALIDFSRAIEIDPDSPQFIYNRGRCRRLMGEYAAALADHDEAVRLARESANSDHVAMALVGRALAHRFAGGDDAAIQDLREAAANAGALHLGLLHVRLWEVQALGGDAAADALLSEALNFTHTPPWTRSIIRFLAGELTAAELLTDATSDDRRCDAHYYIGVKQLAEGNRDDAVPAFEECLATRYVDLDEYDLARWHLTRLESAATSAIDAR